MDFRCSEHKLYKQAIRWLEDSLIGNCGCCRFTSNMIVRLYSDPAHKQFIQDLQRINKELMEDAEFLRSQNQFFLKENRQLRTESDTKNHEIFKLNSRIDALRRGKKQDLDNVLLLEEKVSFYLRRIEWLTNDNHRLQSKLMDANHVIRSLHRVKDENETMKGTIERQKEIISRLEGEKYEPPVRRTLCFARKFSESSPAVSFFRPELSSISAYTSSLATDSDCELTYNSPRRLSPVQELTLSEILATTNARAEVFERDPKADEENVDGYVIASPKYMKKRVQPPNRKSFVRSINRLSLP